MAEIEWGSDLETGVDLMDEQHRRMVEIYNELAAARMTGKGHKTMSRTLGALIEYTELHFRDEEGLMEEAGYPDLAQHRNEHRQLIAKVQRFQLKYDLDQERISGPVIKFLEFWLRGHIQGSDRSIAAWVEAHPSQDAEADAAEQPEDATL